MCKTYTTKETVNYMGINMKIHKKKTYFFAKFHINSQKNNLQFSYSVIKEGRL